MLSKKDIEAALYYHINQNYGGTVSHGNPEDIDPDADSINEWLIIFITQNRSLPGRSGCDEGEITVTIEAHNRARSDMYGTSKLADSLISVLAERTINIQDFDDSEKPVVGYLSLREAEIVNQPATGGVWQSVTITIPGRYQEKP